MNERDVTMRRLHDHATNAKREIEAVLDILDWPNDEVLGLTIGRLVVLREFSAP